MVELDGTVDRVGAAHSLRIMMVVVLVPFAFKFLDVHGLDPFVPGALVARVGVGQVRAARHQQGDVRGGRVGAVGGRVDPAVDMHDVRVVEHPHDLYPMKLQR